MLTTTQELELIRSYVRSTANIRRIHFGRRDSHEVFKDMAWDRGFLAGRMLHLRPRTDDERLLFLSVQNEADFLFNDYLIEGL